MPSQLPGTISKELFFVGDKHDFICSGTDDGSIAPFLDNAIWNNIVSATLTLTPPGPKAVPVPLTGILIGTAPGPWHYVYTFPATLLDSDGVAVSTDGLWDAYWTVTDSDGNVETLGSYQFNLKKIRGT